MAGATILETARLLLREWTLDDVDAFARIYADPEVMRHVGNYRPRTRDETIERKRKSLRHYAEHGFGMWAVCLRPGGEVIGRCGLEYLPGQATPEVEIGWLLAREHWGRGLATEAAKATLGYGFAVLRLPRIVARAIPSNTASIRIMEKLGMKPSRTVDANGEEMVLYAVERAEWGVEGSG